jgi:hypothetical protein
MAMEVKLKSQHLWISAELVTAVFGEATHAHVVYYPAQHSLLMAPKGDEIFPSLHKTALQMLKVRNLQGDKTLSLQEIIIDHEIDDTDRDLPFTHQPGMPLLQVHL